VSGRNKHEHDCLFIVSHDIETMGQMRGVTDKCGVVTDKCGMGQTNAHLSHIFFYMYLRSIIIPRSIQVFKYQLSCSVITGLGQVKWKLYETKYLHLLGLTRFYSVLLGFTWFYSVIPDSFFWLGSVRLPVFFGLTNRTFKH
jgi:hypothetical protein